MSDHDDVGAPIDIDPLMNRGSILDLAPALKAIVRVNGLLALAVPLRHLNPTVSGAFLDENTVVVFAVVIVRPLLRVYDILQVMLWDRMSHSTASYNGMLQSPYSSRACPRNLLRPWLVLATDVIALPLPDESGHESDTSCSGFTSWLCGGPPSSTSSLRGVSVTLLEELVTAVAAFSLGMGFALGLAVAPAITFGQLVAGNLALDVLGLAATVVQFDSPGNRALAA